MSQFSNDLDERICPLPKSMLNLVNERLLRPTQNPRISKLESYFLGYKEFLEQPPSPALSDEGDLFSFDKQSSPDSNKAKADSNGR